MPDLDPTLPVAAAGPGGSPTIPGKCHLLVEIKFSVDAIGRPIAHRYSRRQMRWFRTGYNVAKLQVAEGRAREVTPEQAMPTHCKRP